MIGSVCFFFSSSTINLAPSLALLSSSSSLDVRGMEGRPPSLFTGSGSGFMAMGRGGEDEQSGERGGGLDASTVTLGGGVGGMELTKLVGLLFPGLRFSTLTTGEDARMVSATLTTVEESASHSKDNLCCLGRCGRDSSLKTSSSSLSRRLGTPPLPLESVLLRIELETVPVLPSPLLTPTPPWSSLLRLFVRKCPFSRKPFANGLLSIFSWVILSFW